MLLNLQLLRTVSYPDLRTINEVPVETSLRSFKLTRSLSELNLTNIIIQSSQKTNFQLNSHRNSVSSNESADNDDQQALSSTLQNCLNDNENKLKHSTSTPFLKSNDYDEDDEDDDDVWCNQEDEDNLKCCVKLDQERIEQLRKNFGNETFQIILEALEVK